MKKIFKLTFAALLALAAAMPAQANEKLTVFDGSDKNSNVPFSNIQYQSKGMHSQFIYPADQVAAMSGQQINSVVFYLQEGLHALGGQLVVSMGETNDPVYVNARDFRTTLTEVATISLTEGVTELEINFSTPYIYNGGNLVMDFYAAEAGDDNYFAWDYFYGVNQSSFVAIGANGSMATFLPKATFDYGVPQDWASKVTPEQVTFNTIPAEREDVQVITLLNKGLNAFTPVIGAVSAPFSIDVEPVELASGQSLNIPVKFAPAEPGDYSATLTINCGEAGSYEIPLTATATEVSYEQTVCDGTATSSYLPFYGLYYDTEGTLGQMIYTEDMLSYVKGKSITSVKFYTTDNIQLHDGKIQLSFKVVDQMGFDEVAAISDMTIVGTVVPQTGSTELLITLDEPFKYDGGNLAVETKVIESNADYRGTSFYGQKISEYYPSFYHYSSTNRRDNFLPKATFTFEKAGDTPQPEYEIGDVNHDHAVSISDVTTLIDMLLSGVDEFPAEANVNGDETVSISDVTALIDKLLSGN